MKKERLTGIDLLRILSVLGIFMFHANMHLGISFGILTRFISMGSVFMSAFFALSGFSLYYVSLGSDGFREWSSIKNFYKKRMISILSMYWFIAITIPFYVIYFGGGYLK